MERLDVPPTVEALEARIAALKAKDTIADTTAQASTAESKCRQCNGTGWRTIIIDAIARLDRCSCTRIGVYADGVPAEFREATIENYREDVGNRAALQRARGFLTGSRDLYLFGDVGSGKTRLACSIANEHARERRTTFFVRAPWMLHALQPGRDDAADFEARLATTSLLVLDDLGAERDQATDYTRRTLLMLYEQRHDRGLRTIFTSNKSVQELADMQDDRRLASRIIGQADVVQLTTPDQRRARRSR